MCGSCGKALTSRFCSDCHMPKGHVSGRWSQSLKKKKIINTQELKLKQNDLMVISYLVFFCHFFLNKMLKVPTILEDLSVSLVRFGCDES